MIRQGITVSPADGGYIVSWTEKREEPEAGYDASELYPARRFRSPFRRREAVRTTVEEALKLVANILKEDRLAAADDEGAYIAGA